MVRFYFLRYMEIKLSNAFIDCFEEVIKPQVEVVVVKKTLEDGSIVEENRVIAKDCYNAVILTNEELVMLTNKKLKDLGKADKCITPLSFYNYREAYKASLQP